MNIGIEANQILHGERAIRRYTVNLIRELSLLDSEHQFQLLSFRFRTPYHQPMEWNEAQRKRIQEKTIYLPSRLIEMSWGFWDWPTITTLAGKTDLFHCPADLVPPRGKCPLVITIHGMHHVTIPSLIDPDYCRRYERFMQWCLEQGDYFITVSETMRHDFLKTYSVKPECVRTIPLGVSSEFKLREAQLVRNTLLERFQINRPYLLYVGGIQRHKNVECVIRSFGELRKRGHQNLMLVLVGDQPKGAQELLSLIPQLGLEAHVKMIGYLSQEKEDLAMLYNGAEVFLFPSFYEGWASPPLEAMASGIPVVAANIPSLRENLGEAALFADTLQPETFADKVEVFLKDDSLRRRYQEIGKKHVLPMTWKRMAEETLNFYQAIVR